MSGGPNALVGWSGLVGGNLLRQRPFELLVNSSNSADLRGEDLGQVFFSAARAEKWRANADPAADARHIDELIDLVGSFHAEQVVLVSTVDVYGRPVEVDEATAIEQEGLHAYGANRRRLEEAVAELHPGALVVRLPALFGPGLKKNVVYDLLHDNQVENIQPASAFQYYDLTRLADDVDLLRAAGATLANLVTEPVTTAAVVERAFGRVPLPAHDRTPVVRYDVRTRWASVVGGAGDYVEPADAVLDRLRGFVAAETGAHAEPAQ